MAVDVPLDRVLELVGHDGSEIVWPNLRDPQRRRSFHSQELIHAAHELGYSVTPFESLPSSLPAEGESPLDVDVASRFEKVLYGSEGVLTGIGKSGMRHAVAWDGAEILDPSDSIKRVEEFAVEVFWLIRH